MSPEHALRLATEAGAASPCAKSKRGVVIFHAHRPDWYVATNHPPAPFICDGSEACRAGCGRVAVHAEARAILLALQGGAGLAHGWEMVHVKVVDGQAVPSGPPSCVSCSALILEAGISRMYLLHEGGLRGYSPEEFHRLSLQYNGLPEPCSEREAGAEPRPAQASVFNLRWLDGPLRLPQPHGQALSLDLKPHLDELLPGWEHVACTPDGALVYVVLRDGTSRGVGGRGPCQGGGGASPQRGRRPGARGRRPAACHRDLADGHPSQGGDRQLLHRHEAMSRVHATREDLLQQLREIDPPGSWVRPMDLGGTDASNHSRVLAQLVREGLVERDMRRAANTCSRPSYVYRIARAKAQGESADADADETCL